MQKVVFNAHYLAYCDEAMAAWVGDAFGWGGDDDEVDWMLVRAEIEWQGSATYGDTLTVEAAVERWGTSSFRVAVRRHRGRAPGVHGAHHLRLRRARDHHQDGRPRPPEGLPRHRPGQLTGRPSSSHPFWVRMWPVAGVICTENGGGGGGRRFWVRMWPVTGVICTENGRGRMWADGAAANEASGRHAAAALPGRP